jgi:hypothetical protein
MSFVKPPPIKLKHSALTPIRDQVYLCPVCDHEIPLAPAYGSYAPRAMLSYVDTRYWKHYNSKHVHASTS